MEDSTLDCVRDPEPAAIGDIAPGGELRIPGILDSDGDVGSGLLVSAPMEEQ